MEDTFAFGLAGLTIGLILGFLLGRLSMLDFTSRIKRDKQPGENYPPYPES